ncbi:flavodoxin family protein [Pseudoduganella sp. UC29_106]|uniref:flavodoxin family protein n=1 Tax=Pseudoduganella sp. UC29_106 TaxID=3374553 RepID=UPI0037567DE3
MKKIAIVYHSGYGHTARQAEAVLAGAQAIEGVQAKLYSVEALDDARWQELGDADAMIFGAPTYMGSVSAPFKQFMDTSAKAWFGQAWRNKVAGGFTTSASQSGDKLNSLLQMMVFANQHAMIWVGLDVPPGNNNSQGSVNDLNRLGSFSGAMAQANADQGADAMLESDLQTAARLGRRIAEISMSFQS